MDEEKNQETGLALGILIIGIILVLMLSAAAVGNPKIHTMILPAIDGHLVKRVKFATEVTREKSRTAKEDSQPLLSAVQG